MTEDIKKADKFEKIEKVTLDLTSYRGEDLYSDGDVEERLLELAKSGQDMDEILMANDEWPILYHFSDIRKNLLDWYDFDPNGALLEIGAGCGALSGLFCDRCREVTAIELSKRRSTINAYRNGNCDNLTIRVGNFEDIDFSGRTYDYVTLIGVFEYSIQYIHEPDPFKGMLKRCKSLLNPGGVLFIAIENKYGLKYFAGAAEDHNGRRFESIEGYPTADFVRTFSRRSLVAMLTEAGFISKFYYPYPDYKLPQAVFSNDYLPGRSDIMNAVPSYDRERFAMFDEQRVFLELIEDGYFPDFANSFLIECRL